MLEVNQQKEIQSHSSQMISSRNMKRVVGEEFQVNTYTSGSQDTPQLTALSNGNVLVLWRSYGQDGSYDGIYGRIYNSDGAVVKSEFRVNTYTTNSQYYPVV